MLPKGLYNALPWMYMALGAVITAKLESDIKYLPATLFFLAGILVLVYRHLPKRSGYQRVPVKGARHKPHAH